VHEPTLSSGRHGLKTPLFEIDTGLARFKAWTFIRTIVPTALSGTVGMLGVPFERGKCELVTRRGRRGRVLGTSETVGEHNPLQLCLEIPRVPLGRLSLKRRKAICSICSITFIPGEARNVVSGREGRRLGRIVLKDASPILF
jgi:hypothetical protein